MLTIAYASSQQQRRTGGQIAALYRVVQHAAAADAEMAALLRANQMRLRAQVREGMYQTKGGAAFRDSTEWRFRPEPDGRAP